MAGGKFTTKQRQTLFERAGGHCEVCGCRLREQGWNAHHRMNRGMGGTRRQVTCADGLVVCGSGTTGCHGHITENPRWAEDRGYVIRRNSIADPLNEPVFVRGEWVMFNADGSVGPAPALEVPA